MKSRIYSQHVYSFYIPRNYNDGINEQIPTLHTIEGVYLIGFKYINWAIKRSPTLCNYLKNITA